MTAADPREKRYGGQWTLDELTDLAAGTGSWPDHLRTPVRKLAAEKAFPDLIAAARELECLRAEVESLRGLAQYALHLRINGENAPGGTETWTQWDRLAEGVLRGTGGDR